MGCTLSGGTVWHDISKHCGQIATKLAGQIWCGTRTNGLDFGEDLELHTTIFKIDSSQLRNRDKNDIIARYLKMLWTGYDKTWWTSWLGENKKPI